MRIKCLLIAVLFCSCSKSALSPQHFQQVSQRWIVQEGHDQSTWNGAVFCNPSDFGKIDTVTLFFTKDPNDPNKFGYVEGSIYFHQPGGRIATDVPDIFDRYYCKLLILLH